MSSFSNVIILADSYWDSMAFHAQNMAGEFLKRGYPVYFVERLPQRMPKWGMTDLKQWLFKKGYGNDRIINPRPAHLTVLGLRTLPPMRWLRGINRAVLRSAFAPYIAKFQQGRALLISYTPTYTQIDIASLIHPAKIVYISVHNYDASPVLSDLLKAEVEIINSGAVLGADSAYNLARLKSRAAPDKPIYRFAPGVHYNLFKTADTGNPVFYKKLYHFGLIGSHMDLELYNSLARNLEVTFIGAIDSRVRKLVSSRIRLLPAVSAQDLPAVLASADMLSILYKRTPYIDGVIPAKFFECLATGKPLLVSGMEETKPYSAIVYDCCNNAKTALNIIANLPQTETPQKVLLRQQTAQNAGWDKRFNELMTALDQ